MNKAIFFDRDGVINKVVMRDGKVASPRILKDFEFVESIKESVFKLKKENYLIFVITNQPDIARKNMQVSELNKMTDLLQNNLNVDKVFVCSHDNDDFCDCRKPKPGMILSLAKEFDVDLNKSFVVGDSWKDMQAAESAKVRGILIDAFYNKDVKSFERVKNISEAVNLILKK